MDLKASLNAVELNDLGQSERLWWVIRSELLSGPRYPVPVCLNKLPDDSRFRALGYNDLNAAAWKYLDRQALRSAALAHRKARHGVGLIVT